MEEEEEDLRPDSLFELLDGIIGKPQVPEIESLDAETRSLLIALFANAPASKSVVDGKDDRKAKRRRAIDEQAEVLPAPAPVVVSQWRPNIEDAVALSVTPDVFDGTSSTLVNDGSIVTVPGLYPSQIKLDGQHSPWIFPEATSTGIINSFRNYLVPYFLLTDYMEPEINFVAGKEPSVRGSWFTYGPLELPPFVAKPRTSRRQRRLENRKFVLRESATSEAAQNDSSMPYEELREACAGARGLYAGSRILCVAQRHNVPSLEDAARFFERLPSAQGAAYTDGTMFIEDPSVSDRANLLALVREPAFGGELPNVVFSRTALELEEPDADFVLWLKEMVEVQDIETITLDTRRLPETTFVIYKVEIARGIIYGLAALSSSEHARFLREQVLHNVLLDNEPKALQFTLRDPPAAAKFIGGLHMTALSDIAPGMRFTRSYGGLGRRYLIDASDVSPAAWALRDIFSTAEIFDRLDADRASRLYVTDCFRGPLYWFDVLALHPDTRPVFAPLSSGHVARSMYDRLAQIVPSLVNQPYSAALQQVVNLRRFNRPEFATTLDFLTRLQTFVGGQSSVPNLSRFMRLVLAGLVGVNTMQRKIPIQGGGFSTKLVVVEGPAVVSNPVLSPRTIDGEVRDRLRTQALYASVVLGLLATTLCRK